MPFGTELVALLGLWLGPIVDGHVHKAPHSGVIVHAGPYHIETVVKAKTIEIWILDQDEKTVRPVPGSTIRLTVKRPLGEADQTEKVVTLVPAKDRFLARFQLDPVTGFTARADVLMNGKRYDAQIVWTILDARDRLDDRLDL